MGEEENEPEVGAGFQGFMSTTLETPEAPDEQKLVPPEEDDSEVAAAVEAGIVSNNLQSEPTGEPYIQPGDDETGDEPEAETVFLLTSATYGNAGQGTHIVGVFGSAEAAEAYRAEAVPPVHDGVVNEHAVEG